MLHLRLIQLGSLAAMLAGILRVITSFISPSGSVLLQNLYWIIDALLLLGLISIYTWHRKEIGWWGLSSFALALVGSSLLIVKDIESAAASLYPVAALLLVVGLSLLALSSWFVTG